MLVEDLHVFSSGSDPHRSALIWLPWSWSALTIDFGFWSKINHCDQDPDPLLQIVCHPTGSESRTLPTCPLQLFIFWSVDFLHFLNFRNLFQKWLVPTRRYQGSHAIFSRRMRWPPSKESSSIMMGDEWGMLSWTDPLARIWRSWQFGRSWPSSSTR